MKKFPLLVTLFLVIAAVYWGFWSLMPQKTDDISLTSHGFSTENALTQVQQISQQPHAVGFAAHKDVREYIISKLEELGLETTLQEGYTTGDWANYSKAINIITRIKGSSGTGKALLLLTHYDSNPHSALGASDAGSGVATILEGVRAYLSQNKIPKNDILIVFTDAEELGLNGADLFANQHPWANNIGLILNFEARGSGGPSLMWMETNRGNEQLIKEFIAANPAYPVAYSLVYSVYKMLPNDTDATVFKEDLDIEAFNFAFVDDHFDYHTANDTYERLNPTTLAHQGTYLMPLLTYFADSDLTQLKSLNDYVYFNIPVFKMVSYPFDWIWPMFILAVGLFAAILIWGFKTKALNVTDLFKGFLPLVLSLGINTLIGLYCWSVLTWMYPQYKDMLHGFTYNGYVYILSFVFLSIGICFWVYHYFKKIATANLLVAPIILWLLICWGIGMYLPGAAFFVIPLFGLLVSFMVLVNQKEPNPLLLLFLVLPALFLYPPFIKLFPVALGLKMLVTSTLLTTLVFYLLLPLFSCYTRKKQLGIIGILLFTGTFITAHFQSDFTADTPKPTSLVYMLDADTNKAQWATYEQVLSDWTAQFVGEEKNEASPLDGNTISSKYSSGFTFTSEAPLKQLNIPIIEKMGDTVIGQERRLEIAITPQRPVNRLEIFTNKVRVHKGSINGVSISEYYLKERKSARLVTHYISNDEPTILQLWIPKDAEIELTFYEASNDLMEHTSFTIPPRTSNLIPMPFVLNDAVLIKKTVAF